MQNSYLVVYRCTMDDLPLRLFTDKHFAVMHAEIIGRDVLASVDMSHPDVEAVAEVLGLDPSSPHSVGIMTFQDGRPIGFRSIVDLT